MKSISKTFLILLSLWIGVASADEAEESTQNILVTFENHGANATGSSFSAPYRNRKRYSIAASARRFANAIASEYALTEVDHWPIRALSVYCFVYRVPNGQDRTEVIDRLRLDERIESAQPLQEFTTGTSAPVSYNDKYAGLQHGLDVLGVNSAHQYSRGKGVRIAIIDSDVDREHEDLHGRIAKISVFAAAERRIDEHHGTAVTSIIGALANNEVGIVGVAPEANIELLVACWAKEQESGAVCDSFTLAKALDELLRDPPDILNLSLTGSYDPLLARLLQIALKKGVIVVAANPDAAGEDSNFPATFNGVIGVKSSGALKSSTPASQASNLSAIFAPGEQIMVAIPNNAYDFRSGSSLAAAHVSGVIALLLAQSPDLKFASVVELLRNSQETGLTDPASVDACVVLYLANRARECPGSADVKLSSKLESGS